MSATTATRSEGALADAIVWSVRTWRAIVRVSLTVASAVGSVVTPLGWGIVCTVVASFIAGYTLGWAELITIAWAGLVVVGATLFYLIGRNAYEIHLLMPTTRVVVGERVPGQVVVGNPTKRRLPGVSAEVQIGEGMAVFALPALRRGTEHDDVFVVPTKRRGVIPIGPVRTVRGDPIGLFRAEHVWDEKIELYVHPTTISIPSMSTGFVRDLEGIPTKDLTNSDISFHALREYAPGDERRNIHWKSSAKTGTFMVRQFEETRRSHLMVVLSLSERDFATADEFEMAVSVAGSLGVRAIRDARTVSMVVSQLTPEFAKRRVYAMRSLSTITRVRLLDDLSIVEQTSAALPLAELAKVAANSVIGISVVFLVCGSTCTLAELRAAATRYAVGVEVIAVVCDPEVVPSVRRVGDLSILTIGFLDDLHKILAKAAAA